MLIQTLRDIEAIEAQPVSSQALPESTYEVLLRSAKRNPQAKALSFFVSASSFERPHTWTYEELIADVTRAANAFHTFGVTPDHPVAFVLPNLPETHFTIWGGETTGVVLAINPMLEPSQIAHLLRTARVRALVTLAPGPEGDDLWAKIYPELVKLPELKVVAWVSLESYLEREDAHLSREPADRTQTGDREFDIVDLREAMQKQPSDRLLAPRAIRAGDASSYFCTGGTTGLPKIAVRRHGGEVFDAWAVSKMLESGASPRTFFCGLPLFHVNAQLLTGLLPWMCGDHVVIGTPEGYRGKGVISRFWEIVSHYGVSMFSGVPTIYATLLDTPVGDNDISSLRFAVCGAAPMPAKLIDAFEARTGVKILEGYGLTESTCVSAINPANGVRMAGSIGLRLPYQQMRAVIMSGDGRFERMADVDETGIIAIRGPNVFSGYLDPRHNEHLWIEIGGEWWLDTGDLGRQDNEGYFWLSGRKKELIIRSGHNIDPKIIEEALHRHPAVALAAAIGSPDAYAGEVPVVYIQLKPGANATEQEFLDFAAQNIPERAAVPKHVKVSLSLPLTAVGKIFKPALQQLEIEGAVRSESSRVGATVTDISIDRDQQGGLIANVRVARDPDALSEALDRYAFNSKVISDAI